MVIIVLWNSTYGSEESVATDQVIEETSFASRDSVLKIDIS